LSTAIALLKITTNTTTNPGLYENENNFLGGKIMKTLKRKTRSDKFPLTLHTTGQYCKKVKGKMYYFGSDRKEALQRYLDQATYLHGHQGIGHESLVVKTFSGTPQNYNTQNSL
jgi:YHS domain-containing protein